MFRRLALVAVLLLPAQLFAASGQPVIDGFLEPNGYQQLTSLATSTALTVPGLTKLTLIQAETQSIRWRDDGVAPTASVGMIIAAGDTLVYNGNPVTLRIIQTTASATANVTYYK